MIHKVEISHFHHTRFSEADVKQEPCLPTQPCWKESSFYFFMMTDLSIFSQILGSHIISLIKAGGATTSDWLVNLPAHQKIKGHATDYPLRNLIRQRTDRSQALKITKIDPNQILTKLQHNLVEGILLYICIKFEDNLTILKCWQECPNLKKLPKVKTWEDKSPFHWSKECPASFHRVARESFANPG